MNYDLTAPCAECPFRSDVKPYLRAERLPEIVGVPFSCHKTTTAKGRSARHPGAQHCAGSLILHEKMEKPHQMMRIAERIGLYDASRLDMESPVYPSAEAMQAAYEEAEGAKEAAGARAMSPEHCGGGHAGDRALRNTKAEPQASRTPNTMAAETKLLSRDDWKAQVRALIADRNGNNMPDFDEYLESLAEEYYDGPLADGVTPETPRDAVWNEWQAAQ